MAIEETPISKKIDKYRKNRLNIDKAVEEWQVYRDLSLAGPVIIACKSLVNRLVSRQTVVIASGFVIIEDLMQEANLGVLKALQKFDSSKSSFATYAQFWIKAAIQRHIEKAPLLKFGNTRARARLISKYSKRLMQLRGENPKLTLNELHEILAVETECDISDVQAMHIEKSGPIRTNGSENSLNPFDELYASDGSFLQENDAINEIDRKKLTSYVEEISKGLSPYEQTIIKGRIISKNIEVLSSIANKYGVTRQAVEQKEKALFEKIIKKCKSKFNVGHEHA